MLAEQAAHILRQGCSVIVDAVFAREVERTAISNTAQHMNCSFVGIFLTNDLDPRMKRVRQRSNDASDATPEVAAHQETYDLGTMNWTLVDASGNPESAFARSTALLASISGR